MGSITAHGVSKMPMKAQRDYTWYHGNLKRKHHEHQDAKKDRISAFEFKPAQGIGHHRDDERLTQQDSAGILRRN